MNCLSVAIAFVTVCGIHAAVDPCGSDQGVVDCRALTPENRRPWVYVVDTNSCHLLEEANCTAGANGFTSQSECAAVCIGYGYPGNEQPPPSPGPCGSHQGVVSCDSISAPHRRRYRYSIPKNKCERLPGNKCALSENAYFKKDVCTKICIGPEEPGPCGQHQGVKPCDKIEEDKRVKWVYSRAKDDCSKLSGNKCATGDNGYSTNEACSNSCIEPTKEVKDCVCTVDPVGELTTYDGYSHRLPKDSVDSMIMSNWEANTTSPCKFRLRVRPYDGSVAWVSMGVGVNRNYSTYWRNFGFSRYGPGQAFVRGWKIKGLTSIIDDMPFIWEGGEVYVSVFGSYVDGFVLNSTSCPFELKFKPIATDAEPLIRFSVYGEHYNSGGGILKGLCQNCNGDPADDVL